jgi:hypothetical protein
LLPGSVAYEGCVIARTQSTNADIPKNRDVMTLSLAAAKIRSSRWTAAAFDSAHQWHSRGQRGVIAASTEIFRQMRHLADAPSRRLELFLLPLVYAEQQC